MQKPVNFSDERFNDHQVKWSFQKREPVFSLLGEVNDFRKILFEKFGEIFSYSKRLRRKKI